MRTRKPNIAPVLICLCLLAVGTMGWAWVLATRPAEPFPSVINGKPAIWKPDLQARTTAAFLEDKVITQIDLQGGGLTGVPSGSDREVRKPENIARLLRGLKVAVRLWKPPASHPSRDPSGSTDSKATVPTSLSLGIEPDVIAISYRRPDGSEDMISLQFYADLYGYELEDMERGTFSPEFQDALRAVGIPKSQSDVPPVELLKSRLLQY